MSRFQTAKQAEIIRSNQKDEYYINYIKNNVNDIIQQVLGSQTWLKWRHELDLVGDLGYFVLTTFAGYQTLGEEYVNVVQVDESLRSIPSQLRRGSLILLHIALPYLLDRMLRHWESTVYHNHQLGIVPEARDQLMMMFGWMRHVVMVLHRCHLAFFYLRGAFYHVAKRVVGIRYLLVRNSAHTDTSTAYRWLGYLSALQLALTVAQQLYTLIMTIDTSPKQFEVSASTTTTISSSAQAGDEEANDQRLICPLCLEKRKQSSATPCGHMFCWDCIIEWCASKTQCPLCRVPFEPSRIFRLQNYD